MSFLFLTDPFDAGSDRLLQQFFVSLLRCTCYYTFRMVEQLFYQIERLERPNLTRGKNAEQQPSNVVGLQKFAEFRHSKRGKFSLNFSTHFRRVVSVKHEYAQSDDGVEGVTDAPAIGTRPRSKLRLARNDRRRDRSIDRALPPAL